MIRFLYIHRAPGSHDVQIQVLDVQILQWTGVTAPESVYLPLYSRSLPLRVERSTNKRGVNKQSWVPAHRLWCPEVLF